MGSEKNELKIGTQVSASRKKPYSMISLRLSVTGIEGVANDRMGSVASFVSDRTVRAVQLASSILINEDAIKKYTLMFYDLKQKKRYFSALDVHEGNPETFEYKVENRKLFYKKVRLDNKWVRCYNMDFYTYKFKEVPRNGKAATKGKKTLED